MWIGAVRIAQPRMDADGWAEQFPWTCNLFSNWLKTLSFHVTDARMVWSTAAGDFETTVLSWATNGSRIRTDFFEVLLKQQPRFCLDTELMYLPHHPGGTPHSHGGMAITAHLWHAWLCCPDTLTLVSQRVEQKRWLVCLVLILPFPLQAALYS